MEEFGGATSSGARSELEALKMQATLEGKDNFIRQLRKELRRNGGVRESKSSSTTFENGKMVSEFDDKFRDKDIELDRSKEELDASRRSMERNERPYSKIKDSGKTNDSLVRKLRQENDVMAERLNHAHKEKASAVGKLTSVQSDMSSLIVERDWLRSQLNIAERFLKEFSCGGSRKSTSKKRSRKETLQELLQLTSEYESLLKSSESEDPAVYSGAIENDLRNINPRDDKFIRDVNRRFDNIEKRVKEIVITERMAINAEKENLIREFQSLRKALAQHQRMHDSFAKDVEAKDNLIRRLKSIKESLESEVDGLRQELLKVKEDGDRHVKEKHVDNMKFISAKSKISKLEAELANERRQKHFLAAQISLLESYTSQDKDRAIPRLETQLNEHRTLVERYKHENVSKENVISQMRTKLTNVETELLKVRENSKVLVSSVDTKEHLALKRDLDTASAKIRELEQSQDFLREKKARSEQELGVMQEKYRDLESSDQSKTFKLSEVEESSKVMSNEVAKVNAAHQNLKEQKSKADQELVMANMQLTQLQTAFDDLKKTDKESKHEVISLHKKLTSVELTKERLDKERAETQQHLHETRAKLVKAETQLKRCSRENTDLKRQLEETGTRLKDSNAAIDRLNNQLTDHQRATHLAKSELSRKDKAMKALKSDLLAQKTEYEKVRREYNSLMAELHVSDREKAKVESGLISLEKKLAESETLNIRAKNTQVRYEEENERLKQEMAEYKAKIDVLQGKGKNLEDEALEQKKLAGKLTADLEKLNQEMKLKVKEVEALKRSVQQLEGEKRNDNEKEISLKEELRNATKFREEVNNSNRTIEELRRKIELLTKELKTKTDTVEALQEEKTILQFDLDTKFRDRNSRSADGDKDTEIQKRDLELAEMKKQLAKVEVQAQKRSQQVVGYKKETAALQLKIAELEGIRSNHREKEDKMTKAIAILEEEGNKRDTRIAKLDNEKLRSEELLRLADTKLIELQQQWTEARKTIAELEASVEKMKRDFADSEVKFSGERTKLEAEIANLTAQRDMLQGQLKETRMDLRGRLDEVKGLQKVVNDDKIEQENLGNDLKKLQNTITRLNESRQENDSELNILRKELSECQLKLEAKDWRISNLEGDIQLHVTKQNELEATYLQLEAEKSSMLESQSDVESKSAELKANYKETEKALKKDCQELSVKVTSLEAQLENSEKLKKGLQKELRDAKEALRISKHEFSELQKDNIDHQKYSEGFRQELVIKRATIERLESAAQVLEGKLETLAEELSRNETAGDLLKKEKGSVDKELRGAESRINELEALITNIQNDREKILKEHEACLAQLSDAGRANQSAKEKILALEAKCEQAHDKILDLEAQLEIAQAKLASSEELFGENAEEISRLEKDLSTAKSNVVELKSTCEILEREKLNLKRQLEHAEKQVSEMNHSRKSCEGENDHLLQEVKDTRSKMVRLEGLLLSVTREKSGLKERLEEFKEILLKTKEEKTVLERKHSENLRALEKLKTNERSVEKTRNELRGKIARLEDDLETRSLESTKYQNEFARMQEEKKFLHDELLMLQQKIREFEVNASSLQKENKNLKEEVNSLYQRVLELQGNCRATKDENTLLRRDLSLSKERNEKLEGELDKREQEISSNVKRLSEYELEVGALRDENSDLTNEIAKYEKEMANSQVELQKVKTQNASSQGELEELSKRMVKTKDEISSLQRLLAEKDNIIELQRMELFEKDSDIETLKTAKTILGKDVISTKEQLMVHKEKVKFLEREQYSHSMLVHDKEAKISELEYSLQMMTEENDRLQQEVLNLKALVNELRGNNQKVLQDFEGSQREIIIVRQKLVKIQTKYENLEETRNRQVTELNEMKQRNSEIRSLVDSLEKEKSKLSQEISDLRTQNKQIKTTLDLTLKEKSKSREDQDFFGKKFVELEGSFERASKERQEFESKYLEMQEKYSILEKDLMNSRKEKDVVDKDVLNLQNTIAELQLYLKDSENRERSNIDELKSVRQHAARVERELAQFRNKATRLEATLKISNDRSQQLSDAAVIAEKESAKLYQIIDGNREEMEKQRQELTECHKRISELEAAYESNISARTGLQKELMLANEKCANMEEDVQGVLKTLAQVDGKLEESQSRNEQYRNQVEQLQKRVLEKQRSYDSVFTEKTELLCKVKTLEEEIVKCEREVSVLKQEVSTTKVDYECWLTEKTTLEETVVRLNLVVKEHENEKGEIQRENAQLSKDISAVENELATLQTSLDSNAISKATVEEVSSLNSNEMHLITMMEVQELKLERSKMQTELAALKQQLRELEQLKTDRNELEMELSESKTKVSGLESNLTDAERQKNIAMKNLERSNLKTQERESAMEALREDCALVKDELTVAEKRISEVEASLEISSNRVAELERDLGSARERNIALGTGYHRLQEIEYGLREEIVSLHKRATVSEKDLAEKINQIEMLERNHDEDVAQYEELEKDYDELSRELAEMKSAKTLDSTQVDQLQLSLTSMENKTIEKDEAVKELQIENAEKQFEVDRMKAKISQMQLEISNISQEKTTLVAELDEIRRKYEQDISVSSNKEIQPEEVITKIETYRLEIVEKTKIIESARSEKDTLENKLRTMSQDFEKLQNEAKTLRKTNEESERVLSSNEAKIKNLEEELESTRLENDEIRQKMIEAQTENVCNLKEERDALENENRDLKTEIQELREDASEIKETIDELEKTNSKEAQQRKSVEYELNNVLEKFSGLEEVHREIMEKSKELEASNGDVTTTTLEFESRSKAPVSETLLVSPRTPRSPGKDISTMSLNVGATYDATPLEMTIALDDVLGEYEIVHLEAQHGQERKESSDNTIRDQ